jgi:hypothetical protein
MRESEEQMQQRKAEIDETEVRKQARKPRGCCCSSSASMRTLFSEKMRCGGLRRRRGSTSRG